ncbi:UdgX family uracil-DNA binding protein [soil metagenome]
MARSVVLAGPTDFEGWRNAARSLALSNVAPESVNWSVASGQQGLLDDDGADEPAAPSIVTRKPVFTVPRRFLTAASRIILHTDESRFALLYRLLWRLRDEPRLLDHAIDPDVARARAMFKSISRDLHKMKAYVRFRKIEVEDGEWYIAWFEPEHHIAEAAAPFFVRRFASMRWSILTPEQSVHWDGKQLTTSGPATRDEAPDEDVLESLWRRYYASIFNPARLNVKTMQGHMPQKYWKNLPEAELIAPLIQAAESRTRSMIVAEPSAQRIEARQSTMPMMNDEAIVAIEDGELRPSDVQTLAGMKEAAASCRNCELYQHATQVVFGEGRAGAELMMVGEQPGDKEDLAGKPFVGPAGRLLDRALIEAGIKRDEVYVTNSVKHFKYIIRGERRLHQTPKVTEIRSCRPWLAGEIDRVQPKVLLALGATAAQSLTGKVTPIGRNRGRVLDVNGRTLFITVHPSYLLRLPDEAAREVEYKRFVDDLKLVARHLSEAARELS